MDREKARSMRDPGKATQFIVVVVESINHLLIVVFE